ncbi:unnamed protein product [Rotaria sp. Silwood2]|nr:unnamed protein product [Rotaria sp. Silwood2]
MPNILFFKDTDSELKSLQQSISSEWLHLLQVFRDFSQGNGLISILGTNVEMKLGEAGINGRVLILPKTYNNGTCSCATSKKSSIVNINKTIDMIRDQCNRLIDIQTEAFNQFFYNTKINNLIKFLHVTKSIRGIKLE